MGRSVWAVYFQKENISSLDDSFDFLFSVLSSHAEEESHNISQNKLWSVKRQKQKGVNLTYRLYGYKITDNEYHIIEYEAKVIRKIFDLYINGATYKEMITFLFNHNIPSPTGNPYWAKTTLEGMLRNEKFCGDMMLGKDFSVNGLRKVNHGDQTEKVFVQNNHEGIISKETFARAQALREKRRKKHPGGLSNKTSYAGFLYSSANEKHLTYSLEKPKGKSGRNKTEIPTLSCSGLKPGTHRVGFQVKVILDLLDQVVKELKPKILSITYPLIKELTNALSNTDASAEIMLDGFTPLSNKLKFSNELTKIKVIQNLLTRDYENDIHHYRCKIFSKVIIHENSIDLKISLSDDHSSDLKDYLLIHESTFSYVKLFKPITLPIKVYLGGS